MDNLINKLKGHTDHLLGCYLGLKEKYAILHPMIFDEKVVGLWGSGKKACAFQTMRHSLYQECVQDIIKLSFDKDPRTPSVSNIVDRIQVSVVLDHLSTQYHKYDDI